MAKKKATKNVYNLVVTCSTDQEESERELTEILTRIGETPKIKKTSVIGVYQVKVSDPRKVNERLKKMCDADPKIFSSTYKYIPIDAWCKSDLRSMQQQIKKLAPKIGEGEKWKISVNKRLWNKTGERELILKLAEFIPQNNVSMDNPNKIIHVEIIEKEAGVSLLDPEDVLNVSKIKN